MLVSKRIKTYIARLLVICLMTGCLGTPIIVKAEQSVPFEVASPSALLMESSTGQVIYEKDADTRRCPASITKIMTLLLIFEAIEQGKIALADEVTVSAYAMSMGGSQVYLAEGEHQSVETLIKCIVIASGNDASVAMAEHLAGSEEIFVDHMNQKALALGMENTHFTDCSGLTNDDEHYTSARDVAIMTRELINHYPAIFDYSMIWMEDITHVTTQGTYTTTLSSTNKLLRQYEYSTGLKTGSTQKAKYCYSGTACKDGIHMIAVVMAAPDYKVRFEDAKKLLTYGYSVASLYTDANDDPLEPVRVKGGVKESVPVRYESDFRYLNLDPNVTLPSESESEGCVKKEIVLEEAAAPVTEGASAGRADYYLNGQKIGSVRLLYEESVKKAKYGDYLRKVAMYFLLAEDSDV